MNPESTHEFISWLFRWGCVGLPGNPCSNFGTDPSHIEPKSRGKDAKYDWKNIVLHCRICHTEWHTIMGASEENVEKMHRLKKEFLTILGREEYV